MTMMRQEKCTQYSSQRALGVTVRISHRSVELFGFPTSSSSPTNTSTSTSTSNSNSNSNNKSNSNSNNMCYFCFSENHTLRTPSEKASFQPNPASKPQNLSSQKMQSDSSDDGPPGLVDFSSPSSEATSENSIPEDIDFAVLHVRLDNHRRLLYMAVFAAWQSSVGGVV